MANSFVRVKQEPDVVVYLMTKYYKDTKKGKWVYTLKSEENISISGETVSDSQDELNLIAIIEVLERVRTSKYIILYTDSIYVKCCLNEWIHRWAKHDFNIVEHHLDLSITKRPYHIILKRIYNIIKSKKFRVREINNNIQKIEFLTKILENN